jgi:hypothetical protein
MLGSAFASLTPTNALTRLAFSDVYDALTSRRQNNQEDGAQSALRRMLVEPEQTCDDEIVRLRREMERTKYDTDDEVSAALTEPDTVFFASDPSGNVAAIKVVERTSRNCHNVDKETQTLRDRLGNDSGILSR